MILMTWALKTLPVVAIAAILLPLAAAAECPAIEELGRREARLVSRVDYGVQCGKISPAQSLRLKKELERIAEKIAKYSQSRCLSTSENSRFMQELDGVSVRISRALKAKPAEKQESVSSI